MTGVVRNWLAALVGMSIPPILTPTLNLRGDCSQLECFLLLSGAPKDGLARRPSEILPRISKVRPRSAAVLFSR